MADSKAIPDSPVDDAALQLKKRARRRLVGAVALALLAAIVLPMIMDHEPRPAQQDIQVRIPNQDGDTLSARVLNKPAPAPLPKPKADKPVEAAPVEPAPAAEPVAKAEPIKPIEKAQEVKSETKPAAKPDEVARAEKALAGDDSKPAKTDSKADTKPEAKHDSKADSKFEHWVLQLGAYQDQGNVKVLQGKIKELGYPSYTEKVTTPQGDRIRVRAGPFASKAAAEKAQAALKRIGAGGPPGGVVAPK